MVVVTGAGAGGAAAAQTMAREGARVVVSDIDAAAAEDTAHRIAQAGGEAVAMGVDVSRPEQIDALLELALRHYGRLDGAFNNTGIPGPGVPLAQHDEAHFDALLAVNLKAVWYGMKRQIEIMLPGGGGAIVNTASVGGWSASPACPSIAPPSTRCWADQDRRPGTAAAASGSMPSVPAWCARAWSTW